MPHSLRRPNHRTRGFAGALLTAALMAGALAAPGQAQVATRSLEFVENSPLSGVTRVNTRASVTVDFSGDNLFATSGPPGQPWRPNNGVFFGGGTSNTEWQWGDPIFEDPNDPTSRVLQATLYYVVTSIDAGDTLTGFTIDDGDGDSGGSAIAQEFSDRIEIDTGAARFVIARDGSVLKEAWVGSAQVLDGGTTNALYTVSSGTVYSSAWGAASVVLEENGPAYARVRITGVMADAQSNILTDYQLELCAYARSSELLGTYEVSPGYWTNSEDLDVSQIYLMSDIAGGSSPVLSSATQARAVLDSATATCGMQLGAVASPTPDPYQGMSLTGSSGSPGLVTVSRTVSSQWPVVLDSGDSRMTLNIGFSEHFVSSSSSSREAAEFSIGVFDPLPSSLGNYATEIVHEVTAVVD